MVWRVGNDYVAGMKFLDSRSSLALTAAALVLLAVTPALAAPKPVPVKSKPAAKSRLVKPAKPEIAATPESLIADARAAAGRGDTELALRLAQAAIVADPARPASYDALGDVYAATAQPDFARNYYDQALSIDPADPTATRAIAALDRGSDTRAAQAITVKPDTEGVKTGTP
jgi:tetratricopeptide (TPR) repeat protein